MVLKAWSELYCLFCLTEPRLQICCKYPYFQFSNPSCMLHFSKQVFTRIQICFVLSFNLWWHLRLKSYLVIFRLSQCYDGVYRFSFVESKVNHHLPTTLNYIKLPQLNEPVRHKELKENPWGDTNFAGQDSQSRLKSNFYQCLWKKCIKAG